MRMLISEFSSWVTVEQGKALVNRLAEVVVSSRLLEACPRC